MKSKIRERELNEMNPESFLSNFRGSFHLGFSLLNAFVYLPPNEYGDEKGYYCCPVNMIFGYLW